MSVTLKLEQGVGYSGKHGGKAYLAHITGTSDRYGLEREFVEAEKVERDSFARAKYTRTMTYEVGPGLYELSAGGERWYRIVWHQASSGADKTMIVDSDRAEAIARRMSAGEDYETARLATKPAKPVVADAAQ